MYIDFDLLGSKVSVEVILGSSLYLGGLACNHLHLDRELSYSNCSLYLISKGSGPTILQ